MVKALPKTSALKVQTVTFTDSTGIEPMHDVLVWLKDNFVVVALDESDSSPTWYNAAAIFSMRGVEATHTQRIG